MLAESARTGAGSRVDRRLRRRDGPLPCSRARAGDGRRVRCSGPRAGSTPSRSRSRSPTSCERSSPTPRSPAPSCPSSASSSRRASGHGPGASPRRSSGSSCSSRPGSPRSSCSLLRSSSELFGDPGGDFDLAVGLSRVLFPIVVLLALSGIVVGILNAYDHFTVPGPDARRVEPRDHRRPRARSPVGRRRRRRALRVRRLDRRRDTRPVPAAAAVAARSRRPVAGRLRLARPGRAALPRPDASGHADARADQRLDRDRHGVRLPPHRSRARAAGDRPRVPPLHAAAGHLLGRGRDGALSDARATRRASRPAAFGRTLDAGIASDRLPADPRRPRLGRARGADHASRLRARSVHARSDARRGRRARGVLGGPRLQRVDAAPQPGVLRPAGELDPDLRRSRATSPSTSLSSRRSTLSASGACRWRRRSPTWPALSPSSRSMRRRGIGADLSSTLASSVEDRRRLGGSRRGLQCSRGGEPTHCSDGRSAPRSSPSASVWWLRGAGYLLACRALGVRELGSLLALRRSAS